MTEIIPFRKSTDHQEEESPFRILEKSRWQLLVAFLVSLFIHLLFFGDYYYTFDDAYVFHVYARNVARGDGFSFNPGEISHAATPLLTFVLAAQHYLFQDGALLTGKIVNYAFSLAGAILLFLISYRITSSQMVSFGASLVWAASPLESMLASGPQDFTLFTFLILLSVYTYLFYPRSLWTYLFLSLAILARYEGALFAGLLFLNHLYVEWQNKEWSWRNIFLRLLLMAFAPTLWFTYIGTHSTLLPSSGSAKLNPWALREIPHFIAGMAIFFFVPVIAAALTAAVMIVRERTPRLMFLFFWVSFCLFFYGPFLDNRRYYIHLLPFLALFGLSYVKAVSGKYFRSSRLSRLFLSGTVAVSFMVYFATNIYYYQQTRGQHRMTAYPAYKEAGLWLKENTDPAATVALEEIGVMPYFAQRKLVDFSGWLDLESKKYREKADGINPEMLKYLSTRKPDYIVINTDFISESRQAMLSTDTRFSQVYTIPLLENQSIVIYSCRW